MSARILATALGLWLSGLAPFAALAEPAPEPVVVIELYTAQGCSSCPPADEYFATLVNDPRVILLALHVDYWDYIGWADSFAQARFTERQEAYARASGRKMVYTPQMVVGGVDDVVGTNADAVAALIEAHLAVARPVRLVLERHGERLIIRAGAIGAQEKPVVVQLVRYADQSTVFIERGENAGKTITYRNIVTSWENIGEWTGAAPLQIEAQVPGHDPAVVILQEPGPRAILAAARVE
jgi:hypothetical protein